GFAAYADRFIEINYAVRSLEHSCGRAGCDTGSVRALVAARHLMRSTSLRKFSDINVLYIRARHTERHKVLGVAGRSACVTAYAARLINDFRPLDFGIVSSRLLYHQEAHLEKFKTVFR